MKTIIILLLSLFLLSSVYADSKTDHILIGIGAGVLGYHWYDRINQQPLYQQQQPYYEQPYAPQQYQGRLYTCTKLEQTMSNLSSSDAMALGAQGFSCW